ncbi:MAG TPA: HD domain-containing protein [Candidatus Magasanikbacteria bacterium]|nr:HD domain-containing protein [Candidatus Magasanikbacteria bacterium]
MEQKKIFQLVNDTAKSADREVYAVGGFVRDILLGRDPEEVTDIDFVVIGSGLEFAQKLSASLDESAGSLVEFPDFDTARYVFKDADGKAIFEIEFAGARAESYRSESRKPVVEAADLAKDLSRRDFTVNAMAVPVKVLAGKKKITAELIRENVVDPFHGADDLAHKILRTPLDADVTFSDDPLRMLRAARFTAKLEFRIHPETIVAMKRNAGRLKIISAERINEELFKLLATRKPSIGLKILHDNGVLAEFLPEVSALDSVEEVQGYNHKNNLDHSFKVVDNISASGGTPLLCFAGLLHDIGKSDTKKFMPGRGWTFDMHEHLGKKLASIICRRLRLSSAEARYILKLVRWHQQPIALMDDGVTDSAVRRLIVNLGDDLHDLLILCRSDITTGNEMKLKKRLANYDYLSRRIEEVIEADKLRAFQSPVRGDEIMKECGLKPGPTVGKIKKALEEAILDGVVPNDYEAVHVYFEKMKDVFMKDVKEWEKV